MPAPDVSVVTACHNAAPYVRQCIESVLDQRFRELELILLDDGSTDGTGDLIRHYGRCDPRVRPFFGPRQGAVASWNQGIDHSRGRWIARLDADDVALPDRLERQLEVAEADPSTVLVGGGCVEIDEAGAEIGRCRYPVAPGQLLRRLERRMAFFPHSSYMARRDTVRAVGGYRPRFVRAQDIDLALRLSRHGTIRAVPDAVIQLRRHGGSMSNTEAGRLQFVLGEAACVCHFRRLAGLADPADGSDAAWLGFLEWLGDRLEGSGALRQADGWRRLKGDGTSGAGPSRGARLFLRSLRTPDLLLRQARHKLFGTTAPRRLALEFRADATVTG